jgi:hypothetical protein
MMKYFILIVVIFVSVTSCSTDDAANFYFDFVAVDSVSEIPEAFIVNQPDTLQVSYLRPSSCHGFDGFDIDKDGDIREITIITKVVEQSNGCPDLENDLRTAPLIFNPEEAGEVQLKFFNGEDVDGNPIFLTFNVPIIE